jgi:imidazolonepropionase-like amidohydrolase
LTFDIILKGRAFDGERLREESEICIDGNEGVIKGFGEAGELERPNEARVIDIENSTILPGLIDTHVHFFGAKGEGINEWASTADVLAALRSVPDLFRLLNSGFTTVRELGSKGATYLAQAVEEGYIEGPSVVSCSKAIAQTGGDDDPIVFPLEIGKQLASYSYFCDGPWECRRAVRKVVRDGGRVVKLYASGGFAQGGRIRLQFSAEEMRSIVDEAHREGLKVAAHAYGEESIIEAVSAGVDSIEHGLGLTEKAAQLLKERGVYYVPTLVTYAKMSPPKDKTKREMIHNHFSEDMDLVKRHALKVAMGSDIVGDSLRPHGRNYEEIREEAKCLGNKAAIIAATSSAADCLSLEDRGRLTNGSVADLVVVKGNPIVDIESLAPENVLHVIKSGKIIR